MTRDLTDDQFEPFEQGERAALLQVRSFISKHGTKEVDAFCAQRLHDIRMDARHRLTRDQAAANATPTTR